MAKNSSISNAMPESTRITHGIAPRAGVLPSVFRTGLNFAMDLSESSHQAWAMSALADVFNSTAT